MVKTFPRSRNHIETHSAMFVGISYWLVAELHLLQTLFFIVNCVDPKYQLWNFLIGVIKISQCLCKYFYVDFFFSNKIREKTRDT